MNQLKIIVKKHMVGKRLDLAILAAETKMSRRRIRRVIDIGGVYVNRKRVRVASRCVQFGDVIELVYQEQAVKQVSKNRSMPFQASDILFENDQVIVVNKPPGVPSQATRSQSVSHMMPWVQSYLKERNPSQKQPTLYLVHRLDKETSGVFILAKNKKVLEFLSDQFRRREIEKKYHALSIGLPKLDHMECSCRLSAIHPVSGEVRVMKGTAGRDSQTSFRVMERHNQANLSLVACYPKTGRSHQLRVHLLSLGFPILGDKVYGNKVIDRVPEHIAELAGSHHLLHCRSMTFFLPEQEHPVCVKAPYPMSFAKILDVLRHKA